MENENDYNYRINLSRPVSLKKKNVPSYIDATEEKEREEASKNFNLDEIMQKYNQGYDWSQEVSNEETSLRVNNETKNDVQTKPSKEEKKSKHNLKGLFIIGIGIIALLMMLKVISRVSFAGWWCLFIFLPSASSIMKKGINTGNMFGVELGTLLFLAARNIITWSTFGKMMVPAILINIGINILFGKKKSRKNGD
ncbi:MAG: hypothetical protein MJ113_00565 [Lachnospiraceae bacterium]|nr:hypothetical protein [Lachnospiraceae bacterium]